MHCPESAVAWRLSIANWLVLGAMAGALAVGATLAGFSLAIGSALVSLLFVATYAGVAYYNARAPHRRDPQIVFVLTATAQVVMATVLAAPLTYIAASTNFPLQDANLLAIDRALRIDWRGYVDFVNDRPLLASWLSYGYSMIRWQIFAIPVILCAARDYVRLQQFALAFAVALAVTVVVSAFVPAIGVFYALNLNPADFGNLHPQAYLDQLRDLTRLRAGSLRDLNIFELSGIVTFPSFHAASAALYTWALWRVWWFWPVAVVANGAMLAATPIDGGHYFIDLAAGIAVAASAICCAKLLTARLSLRAKESQETATAPAAA